MVRGNMGDLEDDLASGGQVVTDLSVDDGVEDTQSNAVQTANQGLGGSFCDMGAFQKGKRSANMSRKRKANVQDFSQGDDLVYIPGLNAGIQKLVSTVESLRAEVSQLKEKVNELTGTVSELTKNRKPLKFDPLSASSGIGAGNISGQTTKESPKKSFADIVKQGNAHPAVRKPHTPTAGDARVVGTPTVPRRIMGNKKDVVAFVPMVVEEMEMDNDDTTNKQMMEKFSLPPQREPREIPTAVIRIEKVKPIFKCPPKEWRKVLRERGIKAYSIMYPYSTSVEILIPQADMEKMTVFLREIKRKPENPDPFIRRDGTTGNLSQETVMLSIQQRLRLLETETSGVGMRYLENVVQKGITLLTDSKKRENVRELLEKRIKQRRWNLTL